MDGLRVVDSQHVTDSIERNVAIFPFLDLSSDQCLAAAVIGGGETGELAAAGGAAVTGLNVVNRDPVRHGRHRSISRREDRIGITSGTGQVRPSTLVITQ